MRAVEWDQQSEVRGGHEGVRRGLGGGRQSGVIKPTRTGCSLRRPRAFCLSGGWGGWGCAD
eukprot:1035066-Prorocentrum_minimum.AAC.2